MAVIRHLIARLSAETSDFQSGMMAAKKSLASVRSETLDAHKAFERQMASLRRQGEVFKAQALELDFLAQQEQKAAFATQSHEKHARALTRTLEGLAAMESKSIAISKQAAAAQGGASGGPGGLAGFTSFTKMLKLGGILGGVKFAAHSVENMSEEVIRQSIAWRNSEVSTRQMVTEIAKGVPFLGEFVRAGDAAGRATREMFTGELAALDKYKQIQESHLAFASMTKDLELELAVIRKTGIDREIVANRIRHEEMRRQARQITQTREAYAALNKKISESEVIHLQDILNAEKKRTAEIRKRDQLASRQRWQERFGAIGNWLSNDSFSSIRGRIAAFNAGKEFFKGWFSGGQERGRATSSQTPAAVGASFGSSAAAGIIARSTSNNQKRLVDAVEELVRITKMRKPGVVVEKGF